MNWKDYFMNLAASVSLKSKDPSTKVGTVIVNPKGEVVSTDYNGFVKGYDETQMSWERPIKCYLVAHLEINAILYAKRDLERCIMYTTHVPCENCLKHALQEISVIRDKSLNEQKDAIKRLIKSKNCLLKM